jgi:pantoate--beta-alanine ligase
VVTKLFNILQPDRAYFGQKDAQQVVVVRRLVTDLNLRVSIVVEETVRERNGLALSSRNAYLSPEERSAAGVLYRALCTARERWQQGERSGKALRKTMQSVLEIEPLAVIEYVSAADPDTLEELEIVKDAVLLSLAVRFGSTRLIDNFLLPNRQ